MIASLSVHLQDTPLGITQIAVRGRSGQAWDERDLCLLLERPEISKSEKGHKRRPVSSGVVNQLVVMGVQVETFSNRMIV